MQCSVQSTFSNVLMRDGSVIPQPLHHRLGRLDQYVFKVWAFYNAPFQKILLLDSDNIVLRNPDDLFAAPPFLRHGNLFWPDYFVHHHKFGLKTAVYVELGLTPPARAAGRGGFHASESGQVLFDRYFVRV